MPTQREKAENWIKGLTEKQFKALALLLAPITLPLILFFFCEGFLCHFIKLIKERRLKESQQRRSHKTKRQPED